MALQQSDATDSAADEGEVFAGQESEALGSLTVRRRKETSTDLPYGFIEAALTAWLAAHRFCDADTAMAAVWRAADRWQAGLLAPVLVGLFEAYFDGISWPERLSQSKNLKHLAADITSAMQDGQKNRAHQPGGREAQGSLSPALRRSFWSSVEMLGTSWRRRYIVGLPESRAA